MTGEAFWDRAQLIAANSRASAAKSARELLAILFFIGAVHFLR
jgi:hypothetical protein